MRQNTSRIVDLVEDEDRMVGGEVNVRASGAKWWRKSLEQTEGEV